MFNYHHFSYHFTGFRLDAFYGHGSIPIMPIWKTIIFIVPGNTCTKYHRYSVTFTQVVAVTDERTDGQTVTQNSTHLSIQIILMNKTIILCNNMLRGDKNQSIKAKRRNQSKYQHVSLTSEKLVICFQMK